MNHVYIAGPWFKPEQLEIIENIKIILEDCGVKYFSPMDENLYEFGDDPDDVFQHNIVNILNAEYIIAVTDGKDVGTMFEAGFAFAKDVPILYLWLGHAEGQKFNLMLAQSGEVVYSYDALNAQISLYKEYKCFTAGPSDLELE